MLGHFRGALATVVLLASATACGDDIARNQDVGELGNGVFSYECVDDSDPLCDGGRTATDFPEQIGLDGVFDVTFDEFEDRYDDPSRVRVSTASPALIAEQSQAFLATGPGFVALLAERTSDGRVVDLIHVEVVEIDALDLEIDGSPPRVVWPTGEAEVVTVVPEDRVGNVLAGARDYEWSSSDEDVIRLETANPTSTMELRAVGPGTAVVTVTTGDVVTTLQITAEGDPIRRDAGPGPDPDAGTVVDASATDDAGGDDAGADAQPTPDGSSTDGATDGGVGDAGDATTADGATDGGAG